jgi:hypothetical protein
MKAYAELVCWELLDTNDALLGDVRLLYESTQATNERIPWEWLLRSISRRTAWRPGQSCPHLLVTANRENSGQLGPINGFAYGGHFPSFGGYVCYLGVGPEVRRRGVGTRLFEQFFRMLAVDAAAEGIRLPFVIWESHKPEDNAANSEWERWAARLRLFSRVGGQWIEGVDFLSPDFLGVGTPVALQLFLKPVDEPPESFDADRLRAVVRGLHRNVYRQDDDSDLIRESLPPGCEPRLRPAVEA